ncbi:MAG: glutathione S-transferase [Alphaproteobacteria bacterium]|nr:glutathione S-transferase [Alphaproteobacteria bacterium]
MTAITVHHLENSRSTRILWMLEELELPYELKVYPRDPATMRAPPELARLHPLGKAPVVTLGDLVLAESGAILEHLAEAHGRLRPAPGSDAMVPYRYWLHYAEGSLMPPLLVKLIMDTVRNAPLPFFVKPFAKGVAEKVDGSYTNAELERHFTYLDRALADAPYFAGEEFTAADIQMSYPVQAGMGRADAGSRPNVRAWLDRVTARPAYHRAVEKGGPVGSPKAG